MKMLLIAAVLATAVIVVPLAVIVIGIHRQERAGLGARHAGACAAIARTVTALHTGPPSPAAQTHAARAPAQTPPRMTATLQNSPGPAGPPAALVAGARR